MRPTFVAAVLVPYGKVTDMGTTFLTSDIKSNFPVIWFDAPLSSTQDDISRILPDNFSELSFGQSKKVSSCWNCSFDRPGIVLWLVALLAIEPGDWWIWNAVPWPRPPPPFPRRYPLSGWTKMDTRSTQSIQTPSVPTSCSLSKLFCKLLFILQVSISLLLVSSKLLPRLPPPALVQSFYAALHAWWLHKLY